MDVCVDRYTVVVSSIFNQLMVGGAEHNFLWNHSNL